MYQNGTVAAILLTLLFAFQNCGSSEYASRSGGGEENLDISDKAVQLDQLIKSDLSCLQDRDCEAYPVGHRACGGPETYVVFSHNNQARSQIYSLADEITELKRQFNIATDAVSTCIYHMPPQVGCISQKCSVAPIQ